jgi:hypothetical protein
VVNLLRPEVISLIGVRKLSAENKKIVSALIDAFLFQREMRQKLTQ